MSRLALPRTPAVPGELGGSLWAILKGAAIGLTLSVATLTLLYVLLSPYRYVPMGRTTARVNRLTGETEVLMPRSLDAWRWVPAR